MTETITEAQLDIFEEVVPFEDDDAGEHLTHIIRPADNEHVASLAERLRGKDLVDIARMSGLELVALCGYRWVPKRNPAKYPGCKACFDVAEQIVREGG